MIAAYANSLKSVSCILSRTAGNLLARTYQSHQYEAWQTQALSLIFNGDGKTYLDFTPQERRIVDWYQSEHLKESCLVLPNTQAAIEEEKARQALLEYKSDS